MHDDAVDDRTTNDRRSAGRRLSARRRLRALLATAGTAVPVLTLAVAGPAVAAGDTDGLARLAAPASTTAVWIDVDTDTDGAVAAQLDDGSGWTTVQLRRTAFGFGAVVPSDPGTVQVRVRSSVDGDPDLSLTAVGADGQILAASTTRVSLAASDVTGPAGTDPAGTDPAGTAPAGAAPGPDAGRAAARTGTGALAFTGPAVGMGAVLVALGLVTGGALLRRRASRVAR